MKKTILISEGNRPIWQIVLASLSFTIAIGSLGLPFYISGVSDLSSLLIEYLHTLKIFLVMSIFGIYFSVIKRFYFDFEKLQYKEEYVVGPVRVGKWKELPNIEYVSVFRKNANVYEINLWYVRNKHMLLSSYIDKEIAFERALLLAEKMNIKLLDATIPNSYKWIDTEALRKTIRVYE